MQYFHQLKQRFSCRDGGKSKDAGESREEVFEGEGSDWRQILGLGHVGRRVARVLEGGLTVPNQETPCHNPITRDLPKAIQLRQPQRSLVRQRPLPLPQ